MTRDGYVKTEYSSEFYMISTSRLFQDASHPNAAGAKWIAESIAASMGLAVKSKVAAFDMFDYAYPLPLNQGSGLKNRFNSVGNLTTVAKSGKSIALAIRLENEVAGVIPVGDVDFCLGLAGTRQVAGNFVTTAPMLASAISLNGAGGIVNNAYTIGQTFGCTLHTYSTYLSSADNNITMQAY